MELNLSHNSIQRPSGQNGLSASGTLLKIGLLSKQLCKRRAQHPGERKIWSACFPALTIVISCCTSSLPSSPLDHRIQTAPVLCRELMGSSHYRLPSRCLQTASFQPSRRDLVHDQLRD